MVLVENIYACLFFFPLLFFAIYDFYRLDELRRMRLFGIFFATYRFSLSIHMFFYLKKSLF